MKPRKIPGWQVPFYAIYGLAKMFWYFVTGRSEGDNR